MGKKKRTPEEYESVIKQKYGDQYTLLSKYVLSTEKIHVRHNVCGTEWYPNAGDLMKKPICPVCGKKQNFVNITKTPEKFREEFEELAGEEYTLISEYYRSCRKVKIKHNSCGHIFEMMPTKFLSGQRCPNCRTNKKKTPDDFKNAIKELYRDEFEVVGQFKNTYTPVEIKHNKCGHISSIKPSDFLLKKTFCKHCNQSAIETIISNTLDDIGVQYEIQKTFDGLVGINGRNLSYDFYFKYNNKEYLIEGQGEQHYRPVKFFGEKDKFLKQQEHDNRKRKYAKEHGMVLIEIPYWEYKNIKIIIEGRLHKQSA